MWGQDAAQKYSSAASSYASSSSSSHRSDRSARSGRSAGNSSRGSTSSKMMRGRQSYQVVELTPEERELVHSVQIETGAPIEALSQIAYRGVLQRIPRDQHGRMTSVGSIGHGEKKCAPCIFWFRHECVKGVLCSHCHMLHEGQTDKRIRMSKRKRLQQKRMMEQSENSSSIHSGSCTEDQDVSDTDSVATLEHWPEAHVQPDGSYQYKVSL
eukprot:TRINITY_DN14803_c0_g2_i1.p1 TRINITY_DN14803_c0_g2~~TRINITY_DN14803_c0_g2_i1.p1  ORF type:complete len:212 (-),score=7.82 TRINITY_DN14803_c0_g2_i1:99-734(-)